MRLAGFARKLEPDPSELVPLAERTGYVGILRAGMAVLVLATVLLRPEIATVGALVVVLATACYLAVTAIPFLLHRRKAEHLLAVAQGMLLADGVYLAWVVPYVRGEAAHEQRRETAPRVALPVSIGLLAAGGVASAFVSDWFIAALRPTIDQLGVSEAFAGLVVVALAGNAVENVAGVVLAHKGQSDLAISVVKNSVAQIAVFLFPVLVLASHAFTHHLTFQLAPVYVGAIVLTAIALWQITGDGEATMFEGVALIGMYVTLGAFAWLD